MSNTYNLDIKGYKVDLPILELPSKIKIAFFNLHGNPDLTEHCAKELAKLISDCEIIITAESKGLQLAHCVARNLNHKFYAVARKNKKLYMQDGISVPISSSITTGKQQRLYLSKQDANLIKNKKVAIIDDVVSTGNSLKGLEALVKLAGGTTHKKAFVLAEGDAKDRKDILYLAHIPLL